MPRKPHKTSSSRSVFTTAVRKSLSCTFCRRSGSAISGPGTAVPAGQLSVRFQRLRHMQSSRPWIPNWENATSLARGPCRLLFTENETNTQRIFGVANRSPYVKDSINDYIVHGRKEAVNPENKGTKVAADYHLSVPAGESHVVRLRLSSRRTRGHRRGQWRSGGSLRQPF